MLVIKESRDCLFLLKDMLVVLIELQLILTEDTSFQEQTLKSTRLKLMEYIFIISQLVTLLSSQQDKVMIIQLVVY